MTTQVYPIIKDQTYLDEKTYREWYAKSINQPDVFWAEHANDLVNWYKPFETVITGDFQAANVRWFECGELNVAFNCLDRHLSTDADKVAIIWEGDEPGDCKKILYRELHQEVSRFANVLKKLNVKKGDRVCIYLPMIPEAVIAMLACARIGAVHSVVFAGFSAESLRARIIDCECRVVITANESLRGGKAIPLKHQVDVALRECHQVENVIVVKRTEHTTPWHEQRDVWWHDIMSTVPVENKPEIMNALDPLFILYTSGSTGKPKGIVHGTAGYLVYAAMTHKYVFDYHAQDVFWCTADVGWITGHTYGVYGPLANGATIMMYEGVPNHPTSSRFWEIIDKHKITIFYTAPTAIRALRREGDTWVTQTSRKSLRILGSVGEPINPEAWEWYYHVVGENRCPIVDTWWQTETGGVLMTPLPGATPLKPGSAAWPFFGIVPEIVDDEGKIMKDGQMGRLIIKAPWPGMMQTIYKDHARFVDTYFSELPGNYLTGDQAYRDADGYYWIAGRSDDVIKVSGHRIGTQELESALVSHPAVSEAAVVAIPDQIKGQSIYAYVTLKIDYTPTNELKKELVNTVREMIGSIATPGYIHWADSLPKTRSGKIMRRLLRKIATGEIEDLGDLSTLADPAVVEVLIKTRQK